MTYITKVAHLSFQNYFFVAGFHKKQVIGQNLMRDLAEYISSRYGIKGL